MADIRHSLLAAGEPAFVRLAEWANFLIHAPGSMVTEREAFERIAELCADEHHGIESCELDNWSDVSSDEPPSMEYLNQGETYASTLILTDDYHHGVALLVSSWGDWYEACEREHGIELGFVRCAYCGHLSNYDWDAPDADLDAHHCEHCGNLVTGG